MKVTVIYGNIVAQPDAQAIVNSANANLRLGSGVAGAIHTAAGPQLEAFCRPFEPLALGKALLTPGFNLPNPWVIHLRAAHYINDENPEQILEEALDSMMTLACENAIHSIALPAIGTGTFKFPAELAASITSRVLTCHVDKGTSLK